jgi:DNA-directed RNA polymerase subunit delta
MKINELFKEVCSLLELSENEFMDKLPAFFDVLSTDQRFIMLENGLWDLKAKHSVKIVVDNEDEEEDEEEDIDLEDLEEEQEDEEDIFTDDNDDDDLTDDDDDLKDLVIIDEDEEQMV